MNFEISNYREEDTAKLISFLNENNIDQIIGESYNLIKIGYFDSRFKAIEDFSDSPDTLHVNVMCRFNLGQSKCKFYCENDTFAELKRILINDFSLTVKEKLDIDSMLSNSISYSRIGMPIISLGSDSFSGVLVEFIGPNILSININITELDDLSNLIILSAIALSKEYFNTSAQSIKMIIDDNKSKSMYQILHPKKDTSNAESKIESLKKVVDKSKKEKEQLLKEVKELDRTIETNTKEIDYLIWDISNSNNGDNVLSSTEFTTLNNHMKALLSHQDILDIWVEKEKLKVITKDLRITTFIKNQKRIFFLGKMLISISFADNSVKFKSITYPEGKSGYWKHSAHPHVNENGHPCLGSSMGSIVTEMIDTKNIEQLVIILIEYLKSVNLSDSAGRSVTAWDEINELGEVINKGISSRKFDNRSSTGEGLSKLIYCPSCKQKVLESSMFKCTMCGTLICESCTVFDDNNNPYCTNHIFNSASSNVTCSSCGGKISSEEEIGKCNSCKNISHKSCLDNLYFVDENNIYKKKEMCTECLKTRSYKVCSCCNKKLASEIMSLNVFDEEYCTTNTICRDCLDSYTIENPSFLNEYALTLQGYRVGFYPKAIMKKTIVKCNPENEYIYMYTLFDESSMSELIDLNFIAIGVYSKYLFHTTKAETVLTEEYSNELAELIMTLRGNFNYIDNVSLNPEFESCVPWEATSIREIYNFSPNGISCNNIIIDKNTKWRLENTQDTESYHIISCGRCNTYYVIKKELYTSITSSGNGYVIECLKCNQDGISSYISID